MDAHTGRNRRFPNPRPLATSARRACLVVGMAAVAAFGGIASRPAEKPGAPAFSVTTRDKADEATVKARERTLEVTVRSSRGIGRLTLDRRAQANGWPDRIVIEITNRDGGPLKELEGLTIETKSLRIEGSRRTSGKMHCRSLKDGEPPNGEGNARNVDVRVEKTDDAMRILVPGKLLGDATSAHVLWIDYYR